MIAARRTLLAVLFVTATPLAASADDSVLDRAVEARRDAETHLGRDRLRRTAERRDVTQKMQSAYARLAEARRSAEKRTKERDKLQAELTTAERDIVSVGRKTERVEADLRAAGGLSTSFDATDASALSDAVHKGLEARLEGLRRALVATVGPRSVIDRTGRSVDGTLVRLGAARALVAGTVADNTGLARRADRTTGGDHSEDRQWLVDGQPLDASHHAELTAFVAGRGHRLPIDIDGSLSRHAAAATASKTWIEAGGAFVWPIIAVGLLGLLLLLERIFYLGRRVRPSLIGAVKRALTGDGPDAARALVSPARTDLDRVLLAGIDSVGASENAREAAIESALLAEEPRLERSLTLLAAAAGVAPLLGLLGTVTGMITTFEVITEHGTGNPRLLSGGISVALITTQLGLLVAVPLLLGHAWASRAVERRQALLEEGRVVILGVEPGAQQ